MRILVVDDDAVVRELLRMNFELEGHAVTEAADGASALEMLQAGPDRCDAVLLDVMMPPPDGFDVCARLRADPATASLAIVLLTALALRADRLRGEEVGADAFVTKPFDPLDLVETVEAIVARDGRGRSG